MNKLIELRNELLVAIEKNTLTYKEYTLFPYIQHNILSNGPASPIGTISNNTIYPVNNTGTYQNHLVYTLTGPNYTNINITHEQLEALAFFVKTLEYKDDFEDLIRDKK